MAIDVTTVLVATVSGGGAAFILHEVFGGIGKLGRGVAGRLSKRTSDIVTARAEAEKRADRAESGEAKAQHLYDVERQNRRRVDNYAWQLEHLLAQNGITNTVAQPVIEDTMTPAQMQEIRKGVTE